MPSFSSVYCKMVSPICRRLFRHTAARPRSLAVLRAGKSREARIAITAITTNSSINVKAATALQHGTCGLEWFGEFRPIVQLRIKIPQGLAETSAIWFDLLKDRFTLTAVALTLEGLSWFNRLNQTGIDASPSHATVLEGR